MFAVLPSIKYNTTYSQKKLVRAQRGRRDPSTVHVQLLTDLLLLVNDDQQHVQQAGLVLFSGGPSITIP